MCFCLTAKFGLSGEIFEEMLTDCDCGDWNVGGVVFFGDDFDGVWGVKFP